MTILRTNTISGVGTNGPVFDGSLEFNSQNYVILPKGTTSDRVGVGSTTGALRYNTDSNKVELYDGNQWVEVQSSIPATGGPRGVFGGGSPGGVSLNVIEYINITSQGNAVDFGDLTVDRRGISASSSRIIGVFAGGIDSPNTFRSTIDYITISSTGNAVTFNSSLSNSVRNLSGCSDSTRGLFGGGATPTPAPNTQVSAIDYITFSSTGSKASFGSLSQARNNLASCSNSTRGIWGGGTTPTNVNTVDYVTIQSTGNAVDFGDLTVVRQQLASCSNSTRGLFAGGFVPSPATTYYNVIDFITISSLGTISDFGDLTVARTTNSTGAASPTRGLFAGGESPSSTPAGTNIIDYITIASIGNATDFGDLLTVNSALAGCSNAHGGL
jgi:hypothetical protein